MGFISDHHDIAAAGERSIRIALLRDEFLDGSKNHAAGRALVEQVKKMRMAVGLHGGLPKQILAHGKCGEKLVIKVVAVGNDDKGRVLHLCTPDDLPGIKGHK